MCFHTLSNSSTDSCISLVYAELFLTVARVMTRFDMELFDTIRSRDVDVVRDCIIGLPSPESPGIRIQIKKDRLTAVS